MASARKPAARLLHRRSFVLAGLAVLALLMAVVSAAAAPPARADAGAPIFALPPDGDLLNAFERNSYNEQDGTPEQVQAPDMPDRQALRFSLDGGDQRSEVMPKIPYQHEGDTQFYAYSGYLAPDFPTDADGWQLFLQWHQFSDEGSPPIAVEIRKNRLVLSHEGSGYQDLGPISGGQPIDLVLRITFSRDPSIGVVDVWNQGRHVLQDFHPEGGTLIDEGNYVKVGYYRSTSIDETGTLYLDELRIGPTEASIRGRATSNVPSGALTNAPTSARGGASSSPVTWLAGALVVLVLVGVVVRARWMRTTR